MKIILIVGMIVSLIISYPGVCFALGYFDVPFIETTASGMSIYGIDFMDRQLNGVCLISGMLGLMSLTHLIHVYHIKYIQK